MAADLDAGAERAIVVGADTMLETRLPVRDKIRVARSVADVVEDTPRGKMPSIDEAFVRAKVESEAADAGVGGPGRTGRGRPDPFVPPCVPARLAPWPSSARSPPSPPRSATAGPTDRQPMAGPRRRVGVLAAVAVIGAGVGVLARGAERRRTGLRHRDRGGPVHRRARPVLRKGPRRDGPALRPGAPSTARHATSASRERLILSLADVPGIEGVDIDEDERNDAIKSGLIRVIDDADDRGTLPGWAASALRFVAERAPVGWIVNGLEGLDLGPLERFLD